MKTQLTPAQIITLRSALELFEEKARTRAETFSEGTFWKDEASIAKELHMLFDQAASVELEGVKTAAAAPEMIVENGEAEISAATEKMLRTKTNCTPKPSVPMLIQVIDKCPSVVDARDEVNTASPKERRAAAAFLQIAAPDLLVAVTRRTRDRLLAA